MPEPRTRLRAFLNFARLNLAFAVFLALLSGAALAISLLIENLVSPLSFPHLTLFLFDRTLTSAFLLALGLAVLLTFLFGSFASPKRSPSTLLLGELIFLFTFLFTVILLKKYFTPSLSGRFVYYAFYISHWVKGNLILFSFLGVVSFFFAGLGSRFPASLNFFSLRLVLLSTLLILLLKGTAWASGQLLQRQLRTKESPNVILLTIDTLRTDHLSFYGYPRKTSPHLDALAQESVVFRNAAPTWTKTNQSFAGMLTGKQTYATGLGPRKASFLPRENLLLSEALKNAGYYTSAIVSNANLSAYFNFSDGFDDYRELWRKQKGPAQEREWYRGDQVTQEGIAWLRKHSSQRFFLWIHYIDPHAPYTAPAPFNDLFANDPYSGRYEKLPLEQIKDSARLGEEEDPDVYIAGYDGEIRYVDKQVRDFLDVVDQLNLRENTLLILTSDHGESLVDHSYYFHHGRYAYNSCAQVPLMIRYPQQIPSSRGVEGVVSLIDLFPTVLDFLGLTWDASVQGRSLTPLLKENSEPPAGPVLIESDRAVALRTPDWKLIRNKGKASPPFELYDLKADPEERANLIGQGFSAESQMKELFTSRTAGVEKELLSAVKETEAEELDPEALEQLRSLGYVG